MSRGPANLFIFLIVISVPSIIFFLLKAQIEDAIEGLISRMTPDENNEEEKNALIGQEIVKIEFDPSISIKFGNKFYPHFTPGNAFSPLSLSYAFSLIQHLASEPTNEQFRVLFNDSDGYSLTQLQQLHSLYGSHNRSANARIVNTVSLNCPRYNILAISPSIQQTYGSLTRLTCDNFTANRPTIQEINKYFGSVTDHSITSAAKGINAREGSLVLLDTFYFQAPWFYSFTESSASTRISSYMNFTRSEGTKRNIKELKQTFINNDYHYYQDSRFTLVEIPFTPSYFAFGILLPHNASSYKILDDFNLRDIYTAIEQTDATTAAGSLEVTIPMIRAQRTLRMIGVLKKMGVGKEVFTPKKANFMKLVALSTSTTPATTAVNRTMIPTARRLAGEEDEKEQQQQEETKKGKKDKKEKRQKGEKKNKKSSSRNPSPPTFAPTTIAGGGAAASGMILTQLIEHIHLSEVSHEGFFILNEHGVNVGILHHRHRSHQLIATASGGSASSAAAKKAALQKKQKKEEDEGKKSTMSPPISFIADHPFIYYIRDKRTNLILFVGDFNG